MTSYDHPAAPETGPAQVRAYEAPEGRKWTISAQCVECHANVELQDDGAGWQHA